VKTKEVACKQIPKSGRKNLSVKYNNVNMKDISTVAVLPENERRNYTEAQMRK